MIKPPTRRPRTRFVIRRRDRGRLGIELDDGGGETGSKLGPFACGLGFRP